MSIDMSVKHPLFVVLLAVISLSTAVDAQTTSLEQTCSYAAALKEGVAKSTPKFRELAKTAFVESQIEELSVRLDNQLKEFALVDFELFEVAKVGNWVSEHLLVMRSRGRGLIYFRLLYEQVGDRMALINFRYNGSYAEIYAEGFTQAPSAVECGSKPQG